MSELAPNELVALSRTLGDPRHDLAILAEGNVSTRSEDPGRFWVKASGVSMGVAEAADFVEVLAAPLMDALEGESLSDAGVRETLAASRANPEVKAMPSVETFMHAHLLQLPEVNFVGHTHPTPLLSLLATEGAEWIAGHRLFPDEIVCCGPASVFVPYEDPGLPLARAIRTRVLAYIEQWGAVPKTIWLGNHGLIALGASPKAVESATLMAAKSARVWLHAFSTGRPLSPLSPSQIERIHTRPDEHYRQRLLWQVTSGSATL